MIKILSYFSHAISRIKGGEYIKINYPKVITNI